MTYLSKRLKIGEWKKSIIFSLLSAFTIGLTYLVPPKEPHYAGAMFSYNLSFFLPMLFVSTIMGLAATVYLIQFTHSLKEYDVSHLKQRILATTLFLFPVALHIIMLLYSFL